MSDAPELKPCPRCGNHPYIDTGLVEAPREKPFLYCGGVLPSGESCGFCAHGYEDWNLRHDLSAALVAAALSAAKDHVMETARHEVGREKNALVYAANCIDGTFSPDARAALDALVSAAKREALMEAAEAVNEVREGFVALLDACPKGDPDRIIHAQWVEATRQAFNAVRALAAKHEEGMRQMPERLPDNQLGPDHCLLCWAYDGNLCGRCMTVMLARMKEPGQ